MNGRKLLDTNILIYLSKKEIDITSFAEKKDVLFISIITYMEALGYSFTSKREEEIISALCENLEIVNLDEFIVEKVIELRKKYKIKLPDAIIAATASVNMFNLVTHNTGDFKEILSESSIIDPLGDSLH